MTKTRVKRIMLACVNGVLYDNVGIYTVCCLLYDNVGIYTVCCVLYDNVGIYTVCCVCTPSLTGVVVVVIV